MLKHIFWIALHALFAREHEKWDNDYQFSVILTLLGYTELFQRSTLHDFLKDFNMNVIINDFKEMLLCS